MIELYKAPTPPWEEEKNNDGFDIEIKQQDGINVVDARVLHEILEVNTMFAKWMPRMLEYGFIEGQDFYRLTNLGSADNQAISRGGANRIDYLLTIDCAKEIAMIQRSAKGHMVRQWFINKEKELRTVKENMLPKDYISALRALADAEEAKVQQQALIEQQKPKADYYAELVEKGHPRVQTFVTVEGKNHFRELLKKKNMID